MCFGGTFFVQLSLLDAAARRGVASVCAEGAISAWLAWWFGCDRGLSSTVINQHESIKCYWIGVPWHAVELS